MNPPRPAHSPSQEDPWDFATFEGAVRLRNQHARSLTLHERFQWLDEMLALGQFQKERAANLQSQKK